jgi:hypothetical protein
MVDGMNHHPESAKSSLILMKPISSWNDLPQPRHLLRCLQFPEIDRITEYGIESRRMVIEPLGA